MENEKRGRSRGEAESLTAIFPQTFRPFSEQRSFPPQETHSTPITDPSQSLCYQEARLEAQRVCPQGHLPAPAHLYLFLDVGVSVQHESRGSSILLRRQGHTKAEHDRA